MLVGLLGEGLSEKQMLRLIKNRLAAITCMDNNPMNLNRISQKYHINKQLIMKDYFGFDELDEVLSSISDEEFENKLDEIRGDLERVSRVINGSAESSADSETVPKALVALKFRVPMVFIRKLDEYFSSRGPNSNHGSGEKSDQVDDQSGNSQFYKYLIELKKKLWENRHDLKRLTEIVHEESDKFVQNDIVVKTKDEINPLISMN